MMYSLIEYHQRWIYSDSLFSGSPVVNSRVSFFNLVNSRKQRSASDGQDDRHHDSRRHSALLRTTIHNSMKTELEGNSTLPNVDDILSTKDRIRLHTLSSAPFL